VTAELVIPARDDGDGARADALVAAWLATKRSPHTRAAYLRDLAQWASRTDAKTTIKITAR
jgi:hypothetical protein